jgi:hypothetical protein
VVVFWQPITALFKFYRDGIYETSSGNKVKRFLTVPPKRMEEYTRRTVAKFIAKVISGIGLSYRPARLHRLAGQNDTVCQESTMSLDQGL